MPDSEGRGGRRASLSPYHRTTAREQGPPACEASCLKFGCGLGMSLGAVQGGSGEVGSSRCRPVARLLCSRDFLSLSCCLSACLLPLRRHDAVAGRQPAHHQTPCPHPLTAGAAAQPQVVHGARGLDTYVTEQHVAAAAATHLGSGATYEDYMQLLRVGDSRYLCDTVNDESSAIEPIGTRILRTAGQVRNTCSIRRLLQEGSTPVSSLGYSCRLCFTARQLNPRWSAVKMARECKSMCAA